jgi:hypothetical protein
VHPAQAALGAFGDSARPELSAPGGFGRPRRATDALDRRARRRPAAHPQRSERAAQVPRDRCSRRKERRAPARWGPLALRFPLHHCRRITGRLEKRLPRARTGTVHVPSSSPGMSQSSTPSARQQNCSGSRG